MFLQSLYCSVLRQLFGIRHERHPRSLCACSMVTAAHGALLSCDIPTREYLVNLNLKQPHTNRFIIKELDDTHLWVKPDKVDFIQEKVKDFNNANVYTPPSHQEAQAQGKRG